MTVNERTRIDCHDIRTERDTNQDLRPTAAAGPGCTNQAEFFSFTRDRDDCAAVDAADQIQTNDDEIATGEELPTLSSAPSNNELLKITAKYIFS